MSLFKKTKIVATVGPACNQKEQLHELIKAGVDVFRLNFSHGTQEAHKEVINHIKALNEEHGYNICILQDLQGPKIRTGEVENGSVEVVNGQELVITTQDIVGTSEMIGTTYKGLVKDVKIGEVILVDDGKIELKVIRKTDDSITTKVIHGGEIKTKKGINLPFTNVSSPSLTEKDTSDLMFGLDNDIEWVALSFVRSATDILLLRHIMQQKGKSPKIIAKIEKPEALDNIDEIINVTDGIMVARGDLGVEVYAEEVPIHQKMIVEKCRKAAKPVIIATQMMESMITSPRPTRAETNDIANAVIDGADALMLSAETATGAFPPLVVKSMAKTIHMVESRFPSIYHQLLHIENDNTNEFYSNSLVAAACTLTKQTGAKAIVGMTNSGYTAFRAASHRPEAPIFIFTSNRPMMKTLNLVWGVNCFYYDKFVSTDDTFQDVQDILVENDKLQSGDVFVKMASMPIHKKQRTNAIKISIVD